MKRFLGCLGVLLIFLFGVFVGGVIVSTGMNDKLYHWFIEGASGGTDRALEVSARRLRRELKLTGEQQITFEGIVRDTRERLRDVQRKAQPDVNAALRDAETRVRAILNPEQTRKFETIIHRGRPKQSEAPPTPAAAALAQ